MRRIGDLFYSINPFKLNLKFFKWRIYVRVVKDKPPGWLGQIMLDTYLYGEGVVRVGPEEIRVPGGPFENAKVGPCGYSIPEILAKTNKEKL